MLLVLCTETKLAEVQLIQLIPKYRVSQKSRPSFMNHILRYENSIAIKEVCVDRVPLHNVCDTKLDPIDILLNELP